MRILIFSDIHGDYEACKKVLEIQADKIIILGDFLAPSNRKITIPFGENGEHISTLLNRYSDKIIAVRGNTDKLSDSDMYDFDMTKDYQEITVDGRLFYITHGHFYNKYDLPPILKGSVLLNGHTHRADLSLVEGIYCVNPSSISVPREGEPSYCVYEDGEFKIYKLKNNELFGKMRLE